MKLKLNLLQIVIFTSHPIHLHVAGNHPDGPHKVNTFITPIAYEGTYTNEVLFRKKSHYGANHKLAHGTHLDACLSRGIGGWNDLCIEVCAKSMRTLRLRASDE